MNKRQQKKQIRFWFKTQTDYLFVKTVIVMSMTVPGSKPPRCMHCKEQAAPGDALIIHKDTCDAVQALRILNNMSERSEHQIKISTRPRDP